MLKNVKKQLEINRIGNKKCWIKNGVQHRGLINHFLAKRFINPGGPPVFKLHFFGGQRGLINTAGFINPNLTLVFNNPQQIVMFCWLAGGFPFISIKTM